MKSLIITDVHEENPFPIIERARSKGIERVIFLGDVEHPIIFRQLYDLSNRIFILGNHEECYSDDNIPISGDSEEQDAYAKLWKQNPEEKRRCRDFYDGKSLANATDEGCVVQKNLFGRICCFVHGLLVGGVYLAHPFMGGRLLGDDQDRVKRENFRKMQEENIDILFRGHDHKSHTYSALNSEIDSVDFPVIKDSNGLGSRVRFEEGKKYIVSVGAFSEEDCAVLDEDLGEIKFEHTFSL